MSKRMLQRVLSMLSSAVIIAPTITSAAAQASAYEAYPPNQSSSAGKIAAGFYAPVNDNEFTGTGKGVKIALLDAGVTEYDTYKQVSFIDDDTIGSNHGDLMMSILSDKVPDASVMDVRVLDDEGKGTYSDVCKGIRWAVDNDADIIVMSFSGQSNSSLLGEAVEYAEKHNVFVVAAAGNSSSEQMFFPAAFETVISVGAIDADGNIYDFSNYGQYVDTYGINSSGTSGAAQVVAASAAIAIEFENGIKPSELRKDFQLNPKTFVPRSTEINADAIVYATVKCSNNGHKWEAWRSIKAPTCTAKGRDTRACQNYGCGTVEFRDSDPLGHSYSWVKTADATCTGYGKESKKCSRCGDISGTRNTGPLGHNWESSWHITKQPTCTEEGSQYKACQRYGCGATTTDSIKELGHAYSWVRTAQPTCTNYGKDSNKCSRCGNVSETKNVDPLGHNWESSWHVTKNPTCTEKGSQYKACQRYGCGTTTTESIKELGHAYSWVRTVQPTCTNYGKDSNKCSRCGNVSETKNVDPLGHDWEDWRQSIAPTCAADGTDTRACKRYGCGTVDKRANTNRPAHKYEWVTTSQPTCVNTGKKVYKCSVCGDISKTEILDKLGHNWEDWRVLKEAVSCDEPGKKMRACQRYGCGTVEQEEIIIAHKYTWITTINPTCTSDGKKVYKCSVCGDVSQTVVIPAPGHDYQYVITEHPDFYNKGKKVEKCVNCGSILGPPQDAELVEFTPQYDNTLPLSFNYYGEANDNEFLQIVEKYNGKTVVSLKFTTNYDWSVTAPSYVNIHDKATGKAISSGKAGTYTLYIWMNQNRHFENMPSMPYLTFKIEDAVYSYELEQFLVYSMDFNNKFDYTSLYEYIGREDVQSLINHCKLSNTYDSRLAIDYLCGNAITYGEVKVFQYNDTGFIAVSSNLEEGTRLRINFIAFTAVALLSQNQCNILLMVDEVLNMKIEPHDDNPLIKTSYKLSSVSLNITDTEYEENIEKVDDINTILKFLKNIGISLTPGGIAIHLIESKATDCIFNSYSDIVKDDLTNNGNKVKTINGNISWEKGCVMTKTTDILKATCYDPPSLYDGTFFHFKIADSLEREYIFDRERTVEPYSEDYQITPATTTKVTTTTTRTLTTLTKATSTTSKPKTTTKAPVTTKTPSTTTKAPATTTKTPVTTKTPSTTTKTPATTTKAPVTTKAPSTTTKAPATTTTTKATTTTTKVTTTTTTVTSTTTKATSTTTQITSTTTESTSTTTTTGKDVVQKFKLGDSITATMYDDGSVYIAGEGDMYDNDTCPFDNPEDIKKVIIQDFDAANNKSITSIGANLFNGAEKLDEIVLTENVRKIGKGAFEGAKSLKELALTEAVEIIGDNAFNGCTGLETVTYTGSEKQWDSVFIGVNNEALTDKIQFNSEISNPVEVTISGDTNGDGVISKADGILLSRFIAGWDNVNIVVVCGDINGDGIVSKADGMILARYLAGWEGYEKYFE